MRDNGKSRIFPLDRLQSPIAAAEALIKNQLVHFEPEIRCFARYCLEGGGKRIRAALVFMAGWNGEETAEDSVRVAAIIEMVHLATLVHDDIIDTAEQRRNCPAAGFKFGIDQAVLLGDALFAHALNMAAEFSGNTVCRQVSSSARRVCSGEIMQTLYCGNTCPDTRHYYRIITLKTAELFRLACSLGAVTGGYPVAFAEAAGRFGLHLGIAYQLYDDLLDYFGDEKKEGKTLARDFSGGKATLPLILLSQRLDDGERQKLFADFGTQSEFAFSKWTGQMKGLGVFASVQEAIGIEIERAREALAPFQSFPPVEMLWESASILEKGTGDHGILMEGLVPGPGGMQ